MIKIKASVEVNLETIAELHSLMAWVDRFTGKEFSRKLLASGDATHKIFEISGSKKRRVQMSIKASMRGKEGS